jgi:hypothetical protein
MHLCRIGAAPLRGAQPLHAAQLFTSDYPDGDRGGNLVWIRVREGGAILNLHQFWDGLIIGSQSFRDVRNEATKLRLRPEFGRDRPTELKEAEFSQWAKASFDVAKNIAYRNGQVTGSAIRDAAPALPDGYTDNAEAAAEREIMPAGYRRADVLKAVRRH